MPVQNITLEELDELMKKKGWTRKDFKDEKHYRGWYFRNRKRFDRSGVWHIEHPLTFWYKPFGQTSLLNQNQSSLQDKK